MLLCGSATSLYALGVQAGYSWWQAAAVPVVADGPAIYGMFWIVSRSRRGARGVGYGWLLVIAGTLASIGGNVAHARPDLVAQLIAAAIPLAVLAMLEGLKGDAGEVTRLAARADPDHATALDRPGQSPQGTTVRRTDTTALLDGAGAASGSRRPALPAGPSPTDRTTVGARLQAAYANRRRTSGPGRPGRWPRLPAVAAAAPPASCNASAHQLGSAPNEPPQCGSAGRRPRLCLPGHPGPAPALPPPHRNGLQPVSGDPQPAVGRGCSCRDPGCGQPAKHPLGSLVPHGVKDATCNRAWILAWWTRHPQANIGLATGHRFDVLDVDGPAGAQAIRSLAAPPMACTASGRWSALVGVAGISARVSKEDVPGGALGLV